MWSAFSTIIKRVHGFIYKYIFLYFKGVRKSYKSKQNLQFPLVFPDIMVKSKNETNFLLLLILHIFLILPLDVWMQQRHISVIKEVTCLVHEGMAVGFSKAFYTVPHSIHQDTLSVCGMSRFVVHGAELKGRAQRAVGSSFIYLVTSH